MVSTVTVTMERPRLAEGLLVLGHRPDWSGPFDNRFSEHRRLSLSESEMTSRMDTYYSRVINLRKTDLGTPHNLTHPEEN